MATTLEQIAVLSGVSRTTVSRVINDDANVSPATRARVLSVIDREGYEPNLMARSLASGQTNMLAVVVPGDDEDGSTDSNLSMMLRGIARGADARGRVVTLSLSEPGFRHRIQDVVRQHLVDGVILSPGRPDDARMTGLTEALLESDTRFVNIGRSAVDGVSYVDVDKASAARKATRHLRSHGRRRVALITDPTDGVAAPEWLRGYREALDEDGAGIDHDLIAPGGSTEASGRSTMQRLLSHHPDAVFAAGHRLAAGALDELRCAGIRVPDDVAVVGFGDEAFAEKTEPPLTTVGPGPRELGTAAVNLLLDLIEDPSANCRRVELPAELVVRASCGAYLNNERKAHSAN